jgi:anti-sigma-K factor RskA
MLDEKLAAAQETLFNEPFNPQIYAPEARIAQAASEAGLFAEPMRFGHTAQHEVDESGIPLWITIIVLAAAFALGLLIAIKTSPRRKERPT